MTVPSGTAEIVRLQVPEGGAAALIGFLRDHPYFADPGLAASRILVGEAGDSVVLVLDWSSTDAGPRALATDAGAALLAGLGDLTAGAPEITYFRAVADKRSDV